MKTPWGDIGEAAARKIVRENLWPWQDGGACTPEDLLHMSWFGMQPWLVKLEGETLKVMVKLAALEEWQIFQFFEVLGSHGILAEVEVFRLREEGWWDRAVEMIRNPEVYGPVGDVLDLGWTRKAELDEWIEASDRSWGAYEGVKRLLKRLRNCNEQIPDALVQWSIDVAAGDLSQPRIGHRPASETYRDGAILKTIMELTASRSERRAKIRKLTQLMACEVVAEELYLEPETVRKIWQTGSNFSDVWTIAPAARPF